MIGKVKELQKQLQVFLTQMLNHTLDTTSFPHPPYLTSHDQLTQWPVENKRLTDLVKILLCVASCPGWSLCVGV